MTDTQLKRRLATVLAMDAAGYSRMMSEDEEETLRTLAGHRQIIDQIIESREGRIFGNAGDSVLAEFESPVEAVRCAVEIQAALRTRNHKLPENRRMLFRMGINLGDVTVKDGDLLGDGVNVAARLESTAEPGGICVSSSVYEQTLGKLTLGFSDLGELELKNMTRPIHAYSVFEGEPSVRPLGGRKPAGTKLPIMVRIGIPVLVALVVLTAILWWQQQQPAPAPAPVIPNPEEVLWEEIRNSSNPAEFAAYLEQYPNGPHSQLAKLRMDKLQAEEEQQRQVQATLQQAQEDLRKARDDAANAKAKQQQARLEAELQRAKREAEQARAAMQAEKLKLEKLELEKQKQAQAAAAAKAAAAPVQPIAATPAPAAVARTDPRRYDGEWKLIFECEPFRGKPPFTQSLSGTISNGTLNVEQGRSGRRGYFQASGRLTKEDGLKIIGVRYSPLKDGNVEVNYAGTFNANQLSGKGTFGYRECALTMLRSALP